MPPDFRTEPMVARSSCHGEVLGNRNRASNRDALVIFSPVHPPDMVRGFHFSSFLAHEAFIHFSHATHLTMTG